MKFKKTWAVAAVLAGALATCSATSSKATVINFDSVDTSGGPVSGAPVTNYLAGYDVSFSSADGGVPYISPYIAGNPYPNPVSAPNYFSVSGPNTGFHYTLSFSALLDSLSFTVPGTGSTSTMAAWSATAYSASNVALDTVGNSSISSPGSPTTTYTLTGPGISHVTYFDNVENYAGNHLAYDDLTLRPVPGPIVSAGLPGLIFAGGGLFGWWRRKRKAEAAA